MLLLAAWLPLLTAANRLTAPIQIPMTVSVGLLGFSGDGAWQLQLDPSELFGLLSQMLPSRQPACGPDGRPADANYTFTYNVVQMPRGVAALHKALAAAMRPTASPGRHEVLVSDLESHFARTYESFFASEDPQKGGCKAVAPPPPTQRRK